MFHYNYVRFIRNHNFFIEFKYVSNCLIFSNKTYSKWTKYYKNQKKSTFEELKQKKREKKIKDQKNNMYIFPGKHI